MKLLRKEYAPNLCSMPLQKQKFELFTAGTLRPTAERQEKEIRDHWSNLVKAVPELREGDFVFYPQSEKVDEAYTRYWLEISLDSMAIRRAISLFFEEDLNEYGP
jgi:hypothetical protein